MIELALIGAGWIGRIHAEAIGKSTACRLVALCDPDPSAEALAKTWQARYYRDYRELLARENVQGAVIAAPNHLHYSITEASAGKGVHILLEKPIATSLDEADRLIAAAEKNQIKLLVGHQRRFNPAVEKTRDLIKSGELGKLIGVNVMWTLRKSDDYFAPAWRKEKGAGPILNNLIHDLDNIRFICGDVARVYAESAHDARGLEVEDSAVIILRLTSGAMVSIFITDASPAPWAYELTTGDNPDFPRQRENCYFFFGTEASFSFPQGRKNYYQDQAQGGWKEELITEDIALPAGSPYERQISHFCRVIRGEEEAKTSGRDARRTLAVINAVKESAETGRAVDLT
ncbi:MAG: Gfo/Idh/MocA family oxidoreductase [Smithellaceae bacterium]|nr:Gfo/Idh/MocA family oxidoreductase [Smithellaceae bacterium]